MMDPKLESPVLLSQRDKIWHSIKITSLVRLYEKTASARERIVCRKLTEAVELSENETIRMYAGGGVFAIGYKKKPLYQERYAILDNEQRISIRGDKDLVSLPDIRRSLITNFLTPSYKSFWMPGDLSCVAISEVWEKCYFAAVTLYEKDTNGDLIPAGVPRREPKTPPLPRR